MSATAQFSAVPNIGQVRISGAAAINTGRDGSGTEGTNIFQLFTAGANGSRIDRIIVRAAGTVAATTAGALRIYLSNGAVKRLWNEIPITAVTPTASAVGFNNNSTSAIDGGLVIPSGWSVWVSSEKAGTTGDQFDVIAQGGNF
jgi:hypothetical protein